MNGLGIVCEFCGSLELEFYEWCYDNGIGSVGYYISCCEYQEMFAEGASMEEVRKLRDKEMGQVGFFCDEGTFEDYLKDVTEFVKGKFIIDEEKE